MGFTREEERLEESRLRTVHWKRWGPLPQRAGNGERFARITELAATLGAISRTTTPAPAPYRWGEDGIGGICDRHQYTCFAIALWNGRDRILKERLFGLAGDEGKSCRGRQGVLLLPGLHADALLHEVPLQVPAAGVPLPLAGRRERTPQSQ